ncbi:hypothetical protein PHYBLDRAFT_164736 [Phycomyces blakesleeanus NRRL 1555(-)]|uniref:Uncharacterized protein n=1 Tax=Phycomyces blakesleeanus (strain ATCC 8743b / DSM 1359 / FGSC 10004 / NBRC 33097 / NRRL 1555) TaxID=763407 RepID=A0A167PG29_PHYB8|nr:hypothetical protein PHYBLDRAFT_164736 [Phycomyces blakesleeanus NRRL 1555(-)]OAD77846.1 hypothetical protein PHYBLDRAFT_164736 [Phycomyces blakesleeanus NRRL 1555(-)]|eukprot:XP_018295886.1 hypothetical protein PHYBLDRAFT_164736 [Phycomyces blakesleeanus NRRL 1555(-)]
MHLKNLRYIILVACIKLSVHLGYILRGFCFNFSSYTIVLWLYISLFQAASISDVRDIVVLHSLGAECNVIVYKDSGTEYYLPGISASKNYRWLQLLLIGKCLSQSLLK